MIRKLKALVISKRFIICFMCFVLLCITGSNWYLLTEADIKYWANRNQNGQIVQLTRFKWNLTHQSLQWAMNSDSLNTKVTFVKVDNHPENLSTFLVLPYLIRVGKGNYGIINKLTDEELKITKLSSDGGKRVVNFQSITVPDTIVELNSLIHLPEINDVSL